MRIARNVKGFLQKISEGGEKPSNPALQADALRRR
jgi:hypothetical protein